MPKYEKRVLQGGESMKAAIYNTVLPKNINRLIDEKGFKQCTIAKRAGHTEKSFSDLLNGRKIIKAVDIINISKALGVTPNEIFGIDTGQKSA